MSSQHSLFHVTTFLKHENLPVMFPDFKKVLVTRATTLCNASPMHVLSKVFLSHRDG